MMLVGRQKGHPASKKTEWWGTGIVICLKRGEDLHMLQPMSLSLTVSCSSKSRLVLPDKGSLHKCCCCGGIQFKSHPSASSTGHVSYSAQKPVTDATNWPKSESEVAKTSYRSAAEKQTWTENCKQV